MAFQCEGCRTNFDREGKLIQHLEKSQKPPCKAAWRTLQARIRPVKGGKAIPKRPASPSPLVDPQQKNPMPFEGDFFGNDYTETDFPFPAADMPDIPAEFPAVDEESDDSGSESDTGSVGDDNNSKDCRPIHAMDIDPLVGAAPASTNAPVTAAGEVGSNDEIPAESEPPNAPGGISLQAHDSLRCPPHYITPFPDNHAAAHSLRAAPLPAAAAGYGQYATQLGSEANPWAPFASKMDWEVAQWAKMRGPGSTAFTELLEIEGVSLVAIVKLPHH